MLKETMNFVYREWERKHGADDARGRLLSHLLSFLQPDHEEAYDKIAESFERIKKEMNRSNVA